MKKALSSTIFSPEELTLVCKIWNRMSMSILSYDFDTAVRTQFAELQRTDKGIQLFLITNLLNFDSKKLYKPEEIKDRFENHMGLGLNKNNDLLTNGTPSHVNSANSMNINRALKELQSKMGFQNVVGKKSIRKITGQQTEFEGFPSVWKFPVEIDLVKSIIEKPVMFKTMYDSFLKSGLLNSYWTQNFLTILGVLKEINENDIKKSSQILKNFYAGTPEKPRNRISPEVYIRRLIALRNGLTKLDAETLLENANKMADYIIKKQPVFSIFQVHIC